MKYYLSKLFKKARLSSIKFSEIDVTAKIESGCSIVNSSFQKHSFCGYDCSIISVTVGRFCSIASRVTIGGVAHPAHFVSTSPVFLLHKDSVKDKFGCHEYLPMVKTNIGHDVWIGDGAYIKAGINIGHGAIVGMGSVVTKDVPPYAIVAGNPARLIRYRFDQGLIDDLLVIQWWDWSDYELLKYGEYFNDPQALVAVVKTDKEP